MAKTLITESKANQKKHNSLTRGINTRRKGTIWDSYMVTYKDKKGNEVIKQKDIIIPPKLLFDMFDDSIMDPERATAPFDSLHLDWARELMEYAASWQSSYTNERARIGKINLPNDRYLYRVYIGEEVMNPKVILLEIESSKALTIVKAGRKKAPRGNSKSRPNTPSPSNSNSPNSPSCGSSQETASQMGD